MNKFEYLLDIELAEIKRILLEKNRKYGNAALEPKKIFSQVEARERMNIRLDEKVSRLLSMQEDEDEDILLDITGIYLLRRILDRQDNVDFIECRYNPDGGLCYTAC
jgi:hypothetical protein